MQLSSFFSSSKFILVAFAKSRRKANKETNCCKIHHSYPLNEKQQSRRAEPRDLTQTPNRDRTEAGTESSHSHTVTSEESPRFTVTAVDLSASLSPAPPHHCGPRGMKLVVVSDRGLQLVLIPAGRDGTACFWFFPAALGLVRA